MENAFKIFFSLAILVFCAVVVGIFLIIIKVILIFQPTVSIMGLMIS